MNKKRKKIVSIIGARPQFIKCALLSPLLRGICDEILIHTGQHYDKKMSDIFFDELHIPEPSINLAVGSGSHGEQTGKMLTEIENVLLREEPDLVLVYGDTNSTLAGALAAVKLHIPVAHVEAGLRSNDRMMPEEINRVVTDHISTLLFCPTQTAMKNLKIEGITSGVHLTGDIMAELLRQALIISDTRGEELVSHPYKPKRYYLATIHRPSNTDSMEQLVQIISSLQSLDLPVIFPIHPRTFKKFEKYGIKMEDFPNIYFIEPSPYLSMVHLISQASIVITDSGGLQKEAYILKIPCITIRDTTEWVETVQDGWNYLIGDNLSKIHATVKSFQINPMKKQSETYGDGRTAEIMVSIIMNYLNNY